MKGYILDTHYSIGLIIDSMNAISSSAGLYFLYSSSICPSLS